MHSPLQRFRKKNRAINIANDGQDDVDSPHTSTATEGSDRPGSPSILRNASVNFSLFKNKYLESSLHEMLSCPNLEKIAVNPKTIASFFSEWIERNQVSFVFIDEGVEYYPIIEGVFKFFAKEKPELLFDAFTACMQNDALNNPGKNKSYFNYQGLRVFQYARHSLAQSVTDFGKHSFLYEVIELHNKVDELKCQLTEYFVYNRIFFASSELAELKEIIGKLATSGCFFDTVGILRINNLINKLEFTFSQAVEHQDYKWHLKTLSNLFINLSDSKGGANKTVMTEAEKFITTLEHDLAAQEANGRIAMLENRGANLCGSHADAGNVLIKEITQYAQSKKEKINAIGYCWHKIVSREINLLDQKSKDELYTIVAKTMEVYSNRFLVNLLLAYLPMQSNAAEVNHNFRSLGALLFDEFGYRHMCNQDVFIALTYSISVEILRRLNTTIKGAIIRIRETDQIAPNPEAIADSPITKPRLTQSRMLSEYAFQLDLDKQEKYRHVTLFTCETHRTGSTRKLHLEFEQDDQLKPTNTETGQELCF